MRKLLADTSISNNPKILEELKKAGWKTTTAYRQEKGTRCYQFGVLYRFENSSVIEPPNHSICVTDKQVTHYAIEKTAENKAFEAGSNLTMGNPSSRFEPQYSDIAFSFSALPSIYKNQPASFLSDILSMKDHSERRLFYAVTGHQVLEDCYTVMHRLTTDAGSTVFPVILHDT